MFANFLTDLGTLASTLFRNGRRAACRIVRAPELVMLALLAVIVAVAS